MKFSHSIQFNAVPDWSSHYIAYSNLKKLCVNPPFVAYCHVIIRLTRLPPAASTSSKRPFTKPVLAMPSRDPS